MIEIPIAFCFDKNYVIPAGVAFYSLLENAKREVDGSLQEMLNRGGAE
ncbi:glycosyltransferase family 8 protein [Helicobacter sp. 23-1045]